MELIMMLAWAIWTASTDAKRSSAVLVHQAELKAYSGNVHFFCAPNYICATIFDLNYLSQVQ
jgi:hypothetical protein